ncbi:MAG: Rieske (2Fe-2S) protein [Planctomycetota bacterium]|nr:Rieske (2Fe-2S) protein [Planctomycetota bacterium]
MSTEAQEPGAEEGPEAVNRRQAFTKVSRWAMTAGLVAGYGSAGVLAGRYLYPTKGRELRWVFVCTLGRLSPGESLVYVTPIGERIAVARQGAGDTADNFVALSSTCPHLGCQVHWQPQEKPPRFFCPCHNGVFDAAGKATEGPPADAGTDLSRFPLEIRGTMLFLQVPIEGLEAEVAQAEGRVEQPGEPTGPGHDPCLDARQREPEQPS